MLTTMEDIAKVLKKTGDATTFSMQASAVKASFNNAYLSNSTGYYIGQQNRDRGVYRQTHNILALAFGLPPNASIAKIVGDSIARDVDARGVHLNTGALGTKWLLPTLTESGNVDAALGLALQTTAPSWGFWFQNGANTMVTLYNLHLDWNGSDLDILVGALGCRSSVARSCRYFCLSYASTHTTTPVLPRNV